MPAAAQLKTSDACGAPVADCFHPSGTPQLGRNRYNDPPTLSERSFYERYAQPQQPQPQQPQQGGGYYFDLAACPAGGMAPRVAYEDQNPPTLQQQGAAAQACQKAGGARRGRRSRRQRLQRRRRTAVRRRTARGSRSRSQ